MGPIGESPPGAPGIHGAIPGGYGDGAPGRLFHSGCGDAAGGQGDGADTEGVTAGVFVRLQTGTNGSNLLADAPDEAPGCTPFDWPER